jgi:predicted metal-dependent HD superfamily phosphohydrolase
LFFPLVTEIYLIKIPCMEVSKELPWETASFIKQYLHTHLPAACLFHNYNRTVQVVQSCSTLLSNSTLGEQERLTVLLAAWFLQAGYCKDPDNPQTEAAAIASNYFSSQGLAPETVQAIEDCILSTRYPQQPLTLEGQYLCDAENKWLADKDFGNKLESLRKEMALANKKEFTDKEWRVHTIEILENQMYFTAQGRELYEKKKQKNNDRLEEKTKASLLDELDNPKIESPDLKPKKPATISFEDFKPERTVESLFRNTSRNQMRLIQLADYKANLVISVNALIISVILSVLVTKLDANKYLELPTLMLILTSVSTIVVAMAASRPNINLAKLSKRRFAKLEKNMLFFGHFYKKSLSEYKEIIKETISNKPELYDSLSRDIYYQGLILLIKFRYIILAYNIFTIGLIASILAFIVSFILHHPAASQ